MFVYIFNLGVIEGLQQSLRIIAHRTVNGYYIFSCFFAPAAGFLVIPPKSSRIDGITQYVRDSFRCPATTTGETTLELQRQSSDTWVSESGASIAETQKKVLDLLNLDEETFLVSSMIFQNDAANFTKRPAGQRKAILAQILQLDQYEELQTKAKKKIYDSDTKTGQKSTSPISKLRSPTLIPAWLSVPASRQTSGYIGDVTVKIGKTKLAEMNLCEKNGRKIWLACTGETTRRPWEASKWRTRSTRSALPWKTWFWEADKWNTLLWDTRVRNTGTRETRTRETAFGKTTKGDAWTTR